MFKLKSTFRDDINNYNYQKKPKLKELIAIMIAQYLVILPILLIAILIFGFVLWLMSAFWLT